jgi:hypothetical protein
MAPIPSMSFGRRLGFGMGTLVIPVIKAPIRTSPVAKAATTGQRSRRPGSGTRDGGQVRRARWDNTIDHARAHDRHPRSRRFCHGHGKRCRNTRD